MKPGTATIDVRAFVIDELRIHADRYRQFANALDAKATELELEAQDG